MVVDIHSDYVIDGRTLRDLFKIASRFNDGMRIGPDERRDLAQAMQVKLAKASPLQSPINAATTDAKPWVKFKDIEELWSWYKAQKSDPDQT